MVLLARLALSFAYLPLFFAHEEKQVIFCVFHWIVGQQ